MENSIYVGLSRQMALQSQMDLVSNNVANMNTPGYRSQNMVFSEFIEKPKGIEDPLSMVLDYGHFQNTMAGPMQQTGGPLDVALEGPGYIGVETPGGQKYTRAGNFQTNVNGELITGAGHRVANEGGGAIIIPDEATEIKITEDGSIATQNGVIGKIMISEFENIQALEAVGNGLYKTESNPLPAQNTRIIQGMLEGSNVNPVKEMTRMIEVLRSYQSNFKMMSNEHDRQRTMIRELTKNN